MSHPLGQILKNTDDAIKEFFFQNEEMKKPKTNIVGQVLIYTQMVAPEMKM